MKYIISEIIDSPGVYTLFCWSYELNEYIKIGRITEKDGIYNAEFAIDGDIYTGRGGNIKSACMAAIMQHSALMIDDIYQSEIKVNNG